MLNLDTSIPSAFYDTSHPVRQLITQKWFENEAEKFELYSSIVAIEEIDCLNNVNKKNKIKKLFIDFNMKILELNNDAKELASLYIENGAIPESEIEDSYHIAIATINQIECLASWNFKHIVSMNPVRKVHQLNKKKGYDIIEIGSLEVFGGYKYGNL